MLFYLVGLSCVATFFVFRSRGIDYRMIAIGSLLPIVIDLFIGHPSLGHSFLFPVLLLLVIMIGTINRPRLLRRRLLCIVIGIFFGLVLQGTFMFNYLWFWPFVETNPEYIMQLFPNITFWLIRDVLGLIAIYVLIGLGELHIKNNREKFLKTGRIEA